MTMEANDGDTEKACEAAKVEMRKSYDSALLEPVPACMAFDNP